MHRRKQLETLYDGLAFTTTVWYLYNITPPHRGQG